MRVHVGEPEFWCRGGVTLVLHQTLLVSFIVSPEGGITDRWGLFHGNGSFEETVGVKALPPPPPKGGGTANHLMDQAATGRTGADSASGFLQVR